MDVSGRALALATRAEKAAVERVPLCPERLARARAAYSGRRIPLHAMANLLCGDLKPRPGDLVLARVEKLGQHKHIELPTGRRAQLYVGDEVLVCYGNRYAPDQFEAVVPENLGVCHLVAAGGVAARTLSRHNRMKGATVICPLGLVGDREGRRLNLADWAMPEPARKKKADRYTIAIIGTAMNAGKTTTAAGLIRGLTKVGFKVGAAKVTGTGAGADRWAMLDAGAAEVLDFTDAGFVSTYRLPLPQVESILEMLTGHLASSGADVIVLEVADGLFQEETGRLLKSPAFTEFVDAVIFAAGDAMGALAGVEWLRRHRVPVIAVSGLLTASPLAIREATCATGLPVLDQETLCESQWQPQMVGAWGVNGRALTKERKRTKSIFRVVPDLSPAFVDSLGDFALSAKAELA